MKKLLSLTLLSMILFCGYANARNIYDSRGHLIYDGTLRGQKRAAAAKAEQEKKMQAAAAAKLDYEQLIQEIDTAKPVRKSNYIQSRNKQ